MAARSDAQAEAPPQIGRFTVLGTLGRGGMGVVYAAYDPELDRKVAVKLVDLHAGRERRDSLELARARLLHEAQATARLSHPNVVGVYEVGEVGERVFLAMEYVKGDDLRVYARPPRPWRDVLAAYRQAGAGLAAAHRAGVVHRDFKPDNVLIDREGRVRVVDFGLAATAEAGELQGLHDLPLTASARGFEGSINARLAAGLHDLGAGSQATLAVTGGPLVGTPAYMAPEQHLGAPADARADQFSFCAALYEGLYGERPVPGATLGELRKNLLAGVLHTPPPGSPIPPWLRRVLLRGLSIDPGRRYPAMSDLLADLARDPGQARRRALLGLGLALALLAALGLGYAARRAQDGEAAASKAARRAACVAAGAALLADAWSPGRRAAAERALLATGLPYAADTWARVGPRLDAYAHELSDMSVETCVADLRDDPDAADAAADDPRAACLRRLAAELGGLSDALAAADARAVERAVQAAVALPPPARCGDPARPAGDPEGPRRAAVEDLRLRLARARARAAAGQFAAAADDARAIAEAAADLGAIGVRAEALLRRGGFQEASGEFPGAESTLQDAYFLADQAARDDLRAEIATALVGVVGVRLARPADARGWLRHAWAIGARIELDRELRIRLLSGESGLLRLQQQPGPAGDKIAEALAIAEQTFDAGDPRLAVIVLNAGVHHFDRGDYAEAERLYTRARDTLESALGPAHPDLAPALNNLGSVEEKLGRFPAAIAAMERALAVREASVGPRHPGVAVSLTNLGVLHLRLGEAARAEAEFRRAAEIFTAALGDRHPNLASALGGLGRALVRQGRLDEARPLHLRAREILEQALGTDHAYLAFALLDLADLEVAAGAPARRRAPGRPRPRAARGRQARGAGRRPPLASPGPSTPRARTPPAPRPSPPRPRPSCAPPAPAPSPSSTRPWPSAAPSRRP